MPLSAWEAPQTEHSKHVEYSLGAEGSPLLSLMAWTCVSPSKGLERKMVPRQPSSLISGLWHMPVPLLETPALSFSSHQLTAM